MMSVRSRIELLLVALLLSACAVLTPSVDDKWAGAMAENTKLRAESTQLVSARAIPPAEARKVMEMNDQARGFLNEGAKVRKSNPKLAEAKIDLGKAVIDQLRAYLNVLKSGGK